MMRTWALMQLFSTCFMLQWTSFAFLQPCGHFEGRVVVRVTLAMMSKFQVGETHGSITNVEVKTLFFAGAWMFCSSHVQRWDAIVTSSYFLHCHFILPLSRLLIYPGGDALKEAFVNDKSQSILFCFEEQYSKHTSMHHKWQPTMPSNLRNGWNICWNECSSKTLPKNNNNNKNCWRECIRK
jgi:hypothetical protein